jgi:membrane-associated protein
MDFLKIIFDFFLHLDKHLNEIIANYGTLTYLILFAVIFLETGFVLIPFLPGDSLLFASGTFASDGSFNIHILYLVVAAAAVLGDTVNYWIGHFLGPKVFDMHIRFLKKEYLEKTRVFYEKYGAKTIILARFVPIVRTFAPFVAGIGAMSYGKFILYNIIGGLVWCALFVYGGFYFGNLQIVKNNFSAVILTIILISMLPGLIEYINHRTRRNKSL